MRWFALLSDAQALGYSKGYFHWHWSIGHPYLHIEAAGLYCSSYLSLQAYFEFENAVPFQYYSKFI